MTRDQQNLNSSISSLTHLSQGSDLFNEISSSDDLKIPVLLSIGGEEISASTVRISTNTVQLLSKAPLTPNTPLELECSFAGICYLKLAARIQACHAKANNLYSTDITLVDLQTTEEQILNSAVTHLLQQPQDQEQSLLKVTACEDTLAVEAATVCPWSRTETAKRGKSIPQNTQAFPTEPYWVEELNEQLEPLRNAILNCKLVREASEGVLPLEKMRCWIIQLYPFIETFPKWIALNLTKTEDSTSRAYLIDNIRVEKRHANQWIDMAQGFGIQSDVLLDVTPVPKVEALTHWLWSINTRGSLAEAVAATNYSIEGITQGIAQSTIKGFPKYDGTEGIKLNQKAYAWMEAHSRYDELHPIQALEIMKRYAVNEELQQKTIFAAKRSLEYFLIALETCYHDAHTQEVAFQNESFKVYRGSE